MLTFLAALRHDRITAPCVIDGPINGTSFRAYIEQFLVPSLSPGDVVVMDNLGSHKAKAVRRLSAHRRPDRAGPRPWRGTGPIRWWRCGGAGDVRVRDRAA
jgi:transposase